MSKGGGGAPQQQGGGGDNSTDFLWMIAGTIIAAGLVWYFGKAYIVAGVFKVREWEVHAVRMVMGLFSLSPDNVVDQWMTYIQDPRLDTGQVEFQTVRDVSHVVGRYLSYPVVLLSADITFQMIF